LRVGKTKKAARNAGAERALKSLRLWTAEDEAVKLSATVEVDEDPVTAVLRMQDVIARERQMHAADQTDWGRFQPPRWGTDVRGGGGGGFSQGRGRWNGGGGGGVWGGAPRWGGPRHQGPPPDWSNHGPEPHGRGNQSEYLDIRHRGRPSGGRPGLRGSRGGGYASETFPPRNMVNTPRANGRGGDGRGGNRRGSNRRGGSVSRQDDWNRASSAMTFDKLIKSDEPTFGGSGVRPSNRVTSVPPSLTTDTPQSTAQLSASPYPVTPWTYGLDPSSSTYHEPSENVLSTASSYMPPAAASAGYFMDGTGQSYTAAEPNPALTGFMQPAPNAATQPQTNTMLLYGGTTGYDSFYGQGAYSSF